jgi:hypothetical protein
VTVSLAGTNPAFLAEYASFSFNNLPFLFYFVGSKRMEIYKVSHSKLVFKTEAGRHGTSCYNIQTGEY